MYEMQDYIDAQYGGPGKGFYRIVTNPFQARKVINAGKMAVVMGIETSRAVRLHVEARTCRPARSPTSTGSSTRCASSGVRQMELVNKFDNALAGVAGDTGEVGVAGQRRELPRDRVLLGHAALRARRRREPRQQPGRRAGHQRRRSRTRCSARSPALGLPSIALPLYPPPDHCNARGLTTLGEHTIKALAERHMIFDPDHMSVKARAVLARHDRRARLPRRRLVATRGPTPDAYPRIYQRGRLHHAVRRRLDRLRRASGAATSAGRTRATTSGFGFGADMNGLGAQGNPRGAASPNPVTYPFTRPRRRDRATGSARAAHLGHQRRRRRAVRPLPRLDRGPRQGRRRPDGDARSATTWPAAPRPTCRCGSAPRASRPTPAATPGCASSVSAVSPAGPPRHDDPRGACGPSASPTPGSGRTFGFCARSPGRRHVR